MRYGFIMGPAGDDRTDPQRGCQRPSHPDRHHSRRPWPPRRAPRRRRRLRGPHGDVLRRPRLSQRRTGPPPRPRSHRRATGRHRRRLAPRRPRAARHRQDRHRVTRDTGEAVPGRLNARTTSATRPPTGAAWSPFGGDRDGGSRCARARGWSGTPPAQGAPTPWQDCRLPPRIRTRRSCSPRSPDEGSWS